MSEPKPISADFPFESRFVEVLGSKMHYIEKGEGDPLLFLHGNPTSSYLWRNVIPHLISHGRCIAPDLIGMGKSDKPDIGYRFFDHARYLDGFIEYLDLRNITLVIHDWGSALGFYYAMHNPSNIKAIAFMEGVIAPVRWSDFPKDYKRVFKMMRTSGVGWFMINVMNGFVKQLLPQATVRKLTEAEMQYYKAPYPTIASRKPLRQWPREIPIDGQPADVHEAVTNYNRWLQETEIPKLLIYAKPGGTVRKAQVEWCKQNLKNLETIDFGKGIHFIQEDNPHLIGKAVAKWYQEL